MPFKRSLVASLRPRLQHWQNTLLCRSRCFSRKSWCHFQSSDRRRHHCPQVDQRHFFDSTGGLYRQLGRGLAHLENVGKQFWKRIVPFSKKLVPFKSPFYALPYGIIWGWLPCGLVYSTLTWSLSMVTACLAVCGCCSLDWVLYPQHCSLPSPAKISKI